MDAIEKNDKMVYVGSKPWHDKGKDVTGQSLKQIYQENYAWNVRALPIQAIQPANPDAEFSKTRLLVPKFRAIQREDTEEVYGILSDQYQIFQNEEAFDLIEPLVDSGEIEFETAGSLFNGRKIWLLGKITGIDKADIGGNGDTLEPYIMFSNSHDGSAAARIGFSRVRAVCWNTLQSAHASGRMIKVFHRGNMAKNLEGLRDLMNLQKRQFEADINVYRALNKKEISEADMVKYIRILFPPKEEEAPTQAADLSSLLDNVLEVTPDFDAVLEETEKVVDMAALSRREEAILNVLNGGKGAAARNGKRITLWDAYNAVNEWGLYERGYDEEKRLDRAWFGSGRSEDARALDVAIEMLQAKAAA